MKRLPAFFYALPSGREPVREWLKGLSADDRKIVGEDIKDIEFAWPIGMPLCRPLGAGNVGSAQQFDTRLYRSGAVLRARRQNVIAACLHQEDTENA
jgi:hypothetical protein